MKKWFLYLAGELKLWLEHKLQKANEKQFRKTSQELEARQKAGIEQLQKECRHVAGSSFLSEQADIAERTSIVWHTLDTAEEVGICIICGKQFWPADPEYAGWRKKPCFNKPSSSGLRLWNDGRNQKPPKIDLTRPAPKPSDDPYGFESLSDEEIKRIVEDIREQRKNNPWFKNADGSEDPFYIENVDFQDPNIPTDRMWKAEKELREDTSDPTQLFSK